MEQGAIYDLVPPRASESMKFLEKRIPLFFFKKKKKNEFGIEECSLQNDWKTFEK